MQISYGIYMYMYMCVCVLMRVVVCVCLFLLQFDIKNFIMAAALASAVALSFMPTIGRYESPSAVIYVCLFICKYMHIIVVCCCSCMDLNAHTTSDR